VACSHRDADRDREKSRLGFSFDPPSLDQTPHVLVARGRKPEFEGSRDERAANLGVGQIFATETLEPLDQPWIETRSSCRHARSVGAMAVADVPKRQQLDAL
jgi:hypothetical protein